MFFMGIPVIETINITPRVIEYGFELQPVERKLIEFFLERERLLLILAEANGGPAEYIIDLKEGIACYADALYVGRANSNVVVDIIANACEEDGILHELFS